jgi:hypothetical protein
MISSRQSLINKLSETATITTASSIECQTTKENEMLANESDDGCGEMSCSSSSSGGGGGGGGIGGVCGMTEDYDDENEFSKFDSNNDFSGELASNSNSILIHSGAVTIFYIFNCIYSLFL